MKKEKRKVFFFLLFFFFFFIFIFFLFFPMGFAIIKKICHDCRGSQRRTEGGGVPRKEPGLRISEF